MDGPKVHAVVFDFHATLFHFQDGPDWVLHAAADIGRQLDLEGAAVIWSKAAKARHDPDVVRLQQGRDLSRASHREATCGWLSHAGLDPELVEAMYTVLCAPPFWSPFPDTAPVLAELSRRSVPVAVLSNTGWDIRFVFRHYGVERAISSFVLSYEMAKEKPDPDLFRHACELLAADPASTIMVGDDPVADGGAVFAGMPTLLLPVQPLRQRPRGLAAVLGLLEQVGSAGTD
ncbi:HAD family hydrolase [Actinospica robiniae]|uniref:HAD family hydrolase n=1 Tax=Actinospica robiniae TaxID=304901 RepID=UPI00055348C1|nr:HAD family hydrolase [Actinospica robiniae]